MVTDPQRGSPAGAKGLGALRCRLGRVLVSGRSLVAAGMEWMRECVVCLELVVPLEPTEHGAGVL